MLAQAGTRVAVVDCDLRRPRLHATFGLSNDAGFTSILLDEVPVASAGALARDHANLFVIPSGPPPPNPSELLSGNRAREAVAALRDMFDVVLFDSPPVLPVSDSLVLSGLVDGVLLVTSASRANTPDVRRAVELLQQVRAPIVGTLLDGADDSVGYDAGYRYGYDVPSSRGRRGKHGKGGKHTAAPRLVGSRSI